MTPPRLVRSWLCAILVMTTGASLVRGDDPLAPNATIGLDAKLAHPVISPKGDYLYWLNQSDGKLQRASLADNRLDEHAVDVAPGARDFCLSPDGATAYVAATANEFSAYREGAKQQGTIQSIKLADLTVTGSFDVAIDPFEMVTDAKGFIFVTPGSGQWEKIYKIDPVKKKVLFGFSTVYGGSNLRITPNRQRLYLASNGLSPGDIAAIPVPDVTSNAWPVDSPYHGEYPLGGAFDITPDGKYAVNRAGTVVRLGTAKGADLLYVTKVAPNLGTACDPAGGKLWAIQADGHLLTYSYPGFKEEKSEKLVSHGEAIVYDAAHKTLWVAWAGSAGGIGGLDAYNLASPATYPNDITKAREGAPEPATPAPVAATPAPVTPAAAPTPAPASSSAAHALPSSASRAAAPTPSSTAPAPAAAQFAPNTPSGREANLAAVRGDLIVRALIAISFLLLLASIFLGRRTPREHALHGAQVNLDDPSQWPVPGSIKFIGWFTWFQVFALFCLVTGLGLPGIEEKVLGFARSLALYATLTGALAWGILRGNKICYVLYAVLLIGGTALGASRGAGPGVVAVLWLFAIVHYGRKEWDSLS